MGEKTIRNKKIAHIVTSYVIISIIDVFNVFTQGFYSIFLFYGHIRKYSSASKPCLSLV